MILLLKYWRELGLAILAVVLFGMWRSREHALVERGRAIERVRVADSALAVLRSALARADTQVVTQIRTVTREIARVDTLRDSIPVWRHDTTYIREYVTRTDSALAVCTDLAGSCALFRTTANATIAALEVKVRAIPFAVPRSCAPTGVVTFGVGALAGFFGGRALR